MSRMNTNGRRRIGYRRPPRARTSVRAGAAHGRAIALVAAIGLFSIGARPSPQDPPGVDEARAALEKWVEIKRVISRERRDWALGRELLDERIELVQREIETLRGRIEEANAGIEEMDRSRAGLMTENERLKSVSATLDETVSLLERRTLDLLRRLPDPVRNRVRPLSQQIPAPPTPGESAAAGGTASTTLSLSQRFQNVIGVLNEVNKFNREITVEPEVRTLPDGSAVQVAAVYIGISHGFYVDANGALAGIGAPAADGWTWKPADHIAPQVAGIVAMLNNERVAEFVPLPIEIK